MNLSISRDGLEIGVWTEDEVRSLYKAGKLFDTDHYWREGMEEWSTLAKFIKPPPPTSVKSSPQAAKLSSPSSTKLIPQPTETTSASVSQRDSPKQEIEPTDISAWTENEAEKKPLSGWVLWPLILWIVFTIAGFVAPGHLQIIGCILVSIFLVAFGKAVLVLAKGAVRFVGRFRNKMKGLKGSGANKLDPIIVEASSYLESAAMQKQILQAFFGYAGIDKDRSERLYEESPLGIAGNKDLCQTIVTLPNGSSMSVWFDLSAVTAAVKQS